jgi:hypothetical protein
MSAKPTKPKRIEVTMNNNNVFEAWRQAQTDNGIVPGGAMKLDLKNIVTQDELATLGL